MEEKKRTKPDFTAIYREIPQKWLVVLGAAAAVIALAMCFEYSLRSVAREMAEAQGDSLAAEAVSFAVNQSGSQHQYDELVDLEKDELGNITMVKVNGYVLNELTREMVELCEDTGNVYETVAIIGKRANQIAVEMKNDLSKKLQEFASYNDNLEEVFENREQIEISRYYEKLPKPTLIAAQEYEEGKVYYRNPAKEKEKLQ
mgnify:CR=1 FL=1